MAQEAKLNNVTELAFLLLFFLDINRFSALSKSLMILDA